MAETQLSADDVVTLFDNTHHQPHAHQHWYHT